MAGMNVESDGGGLVMGMREDYEAFMEKRLNEWKEQTERLKVEAEQMETQAKAQFHKQLEFLHAKQEEAWDTFHEMKKNSEDTWEQFKARMDKASEELKNAAERVAKQFKK
jgi:hypothetical protein